MPSRSRIGRGIAMSEMHTQPNRIKCANMLSIFDNISGRLHEYLQTEMSASGQFAHRLCIVTNEGLDE
jgi:hypothetical protein